MFVDELCGYGVGMLSGNAEPPLLAEVFLKVWQEVGMPAARTDKVALRQAPGEGQGARDKGLSLRMK